MAETYLVRAKLDGLFAPWEPELTLPVSFGPFRLNYSPNSRLRRTELEFVRRDKDLPQGYMHGYPVSLFYVDAEVEVDGEKAYPLSVADSMFGLLEAMFRLFQSGGVYVHRHEVWQLKQGAPSGAVGWRTPIFPVTARPPALHRHGNYRLEDVTLAEFVEFFDCYWDIIQQKPQPLHNALTRFSSSYERESSADRLVELMIAMNALFGSKEQDKLSIARKSACIIYPQGEARELAFHAIKQLYDERSDIVHGRSLASESDAERIDKFEEYVRLSITKVLELYKDGHLHALHLKGFRREFDQWFFFAKCLKCRPSL